MGRQRSYINQGSKKTFKTRAVVGYFDGPNLYGAQLIRVIKGIIKSRRVVDYFRVRYFMDHIFTGCVETIIKANKRSPSETRISRKLRTFFLCGIFCG